MDGCVGAGKASDVAKSCLIVQESWQLNGTSLNGTLPCRCRVPYRVEDPVVCFDLRALCVVKGYGGS